LFKPRQLLKGLSRRQLSFFLFQMIDFYYVRALIVRTILKTIKIIYTMENIKTIQQVEPAVVVRANTNKAGKAGLILAILGLILSWVPVVGWGCWISGLIASIVGLFNAPRGMAIAGLIISFIDLIILIALIGTLALIL